MSGFPLNGFLGLSQASFLRSNAITFLHIVWRSDLHEYLKGWSHFKDSSWSQQSMHDHLGGGWPSNKWFKNKTRVSFCGSDPSFDSTMLGELSTLFLIPRLDGTGLLWNPDVDHMIKARIESSSDVEHMYQNSRIRYSTDDISSYCSYPRNGTQYKA